VNFPDMKALAAKPQTAGSIRKAFVARNRGIRPEMLAVSARDGWLTEVRYCLGPRMKPQRCLPFQRGLDDKRAVKVRPMPR